MSVPRSAVMIIDGNSTDNAEMDMSRFHAPAQSPMPMYPPPMGGMPPAWQPPAGLPPKEQAEEPYRQPPYGDRYGDGYNQPYGRESYGDRYGDRYGDSYDQAPQVPQAPQAPQPPQPPQEEEETREPWLVRGVRVRLANEAMGVVMEVKPHGVCAVEVDDSDVRDVEAAELQPVRPFMADQEVMVYDDPNNCYRATVLKVDGEDLLVSAEGSKMMVHNAVVIDVSIYELSLC